MCLFSLASTSLGDIKNTPHNLLSDSRAAEIENNQAICMPCHVPTGTAVPGTASDPLSNISGQQPGYASLLCLGCHDGVQAGGIEITTPNISPKTATEMEQIFIAGSTQAANPAAVLVSGSSMHSSHPVGIPYARGAFVADIPAVSAGVTTQSRRSTLREFFRPQSDVIDGKKVWWVETGGAGRQKDDIPLYAREGFEGAEGTPYVECSSCHDPHSDAPLFLRISNKGSRLCLSCHVL